MANSICVNKKAYLISAKAPGLEQKTAQYCADSALHEIEAIKTVKSFESKIQRFLLMDVLHIT